MLKNHLRNPEARCARGRRQERGTEAHKGSRLDAALTYVGSGLTLVLAVALLACSGESPRGDATQQDSGVSTSVADSPVLAQAAAQLRPTMPQVPRLAAALSTTYTLQGDYRAQNLIDGQLSTTAATTTSVSGANWAAVQIAPTAHVGSVGVYNRHDYPNFRSWLGDFQVRGSAASPGALTDRQRFLGHDSPPTAHTTL